MWNVLLCDNRKSVRAELSSQIACQYGPRSVQITMFQGGERLLFYLEEKTLFAGLIFLALETDGGTGIKIAQKIARLAPDAFIVFYADKDIYYPDVYAVSHLYFLKRPIEEFRLKDVLRLAEERLAHNSMQYIVIHNKKAIRKILVSQILYAEKERRKVWIHVENRALNDPVKVGFYGQMDDFLNMVKPFSYMIRCHQSFSINLSKALELSDQSFTLQDGRQIPVSRTYRKAARQAYLDFLNQITF